MMAAKSKSTGRNPLPKGEKKVPVHAGYCKEKNRAAIVKVLKPIVEKMDKA